MLKYISVFCAFASLLIDAAISGTEAYLCSSPAVLGFTSYVCFCSMQHFTILLPFTLLLNNLSAIAGLRSAPEYAGVVNIFGRIAEHKALGYTSSYSEYSPTPLALWLPNRWSRRLRVNDPDWKLLFTEGAQEIDRSQFGINLASLPFKYPADCDIPDELRVELSSELTGLVAGEDVVRSPFGAALLAKMEAAMQVKPISESLIDATFFLFGGRNGRLAIGTMESACLEWGMLSCADDPVIDFAAFSSRVLQRAEQTRRAGQSA